MPASPPIPGRAFCWQPCGAPVSAALVQRLLLGCGQPDETKSSWGAPPFRLLLLFSARDPRGLDAAQVARGGESYRKAEKSITLGYTSPKR